MDNAKRALKIFSILGRKYGRSLHKNENPFFVLIFTVLSARNRDSQTYKAANILFKRFPTIRSLGAAAVGDIERCIRFIGLYRQKARRVKRISQLLLQRHAGKVPDDFGQLLELPGVGRKTASCVLIYAFKKPAIAVDTHVFRVSNRLGIVNAKNELKVEEALKRLLPKSRWLEVNELLVRHGQQVCLPGIPRCLICPVRKYCDYLRLEPKTSLASS